MVELSDKIRIVGWKGYDGILREICYHYCNWRSIAGLCGVWWEWSVHGRLGESF
jgi:hypothetical protein